MSFITYIDSKGQPIKEDKLFDYFLEPFSVKGVDTKSLDKFLKLMDFTGGISLEHNEYKKTLNELPNKIKYFINEFSYYNKKLEKVFLRSIEYHLYIKHNEIRNKIRANLIENCEKINELEGFQFPKFEELDLNKKTLYSMILDHIKHYSLSLLNAVYYGMIKDENINEKYFFQIEQFCKEKINDYYSFILNKKKPIITKFPHNILELFPKLELPTYNPDEDSGKWGGRKMIVRDADHSGNILLYSGQFLDLKKSFDAVINPLCGAAEIGYAIQEIGSVFGKNPIKKVELLRYCVYEERHGDEIDHLPLTIFIPKRLTKSFEESIKKEKIIIIDDGISKGQTMIGLRNYLNVNYKIVPEISSIDFSKEEDNLIKLNETLIPPIADRITKKIGNIIRDQIEKPLNKLETINILRENNEITQEVYNKAYVKFKPKTI